MAKDAEFQISRGSPAPLRSDDIERKVRGERDLVVNQKIASRPLYTSVRPTTAAKARFSPVEVDREELRTIAEGGTTPDSIKEKLERSAKQRGRFGASKEISAEKQRPKRTSPQDSG